MTFIIAKPATLIYYSDALSLAGQVLAPLRAFLDIVLACRESTDEVEDISSSSRKKSNDNILYGAVAAYVSLVSFSANKICHVHVRYNVTLP